MLNIADGTVFVISSKDTKKQDAIEALTQERNGVHILGSVLTKVEIGASHYEGYYTNK